MGDSSKCTSMSVMTVREGSIGGWSVDGPPFVDIAHEGSSPE